VAIALYLLPTTAFAQVEKRPALLIGNQGYSSQIGKLTNPHNDIAPATPSTCGVRRLPPLPLQV
jgi:hypothetical protein